MLKTTGSLVVGALIGIFFYHFGLKVAGQSIVSNEFLDNQQAQITALETDNRLLSDDLFGVGRVSDPNAGGFNYPYDDTLDARAAVAAVREAAIENDRYLMITFGANWCVDCRTLYKTLNSDVVSEYTKDLFMFANVDVGEFNRNLELANDLGVNLERGIPVAIFYDQSGEIIGATNSGELEPARLYSSTQILNFVKDIAERGDILAPGTVR